MKIFEIGIVRSLLWFFFILIAQDLPKFNNTSAYFDVKMNCLIGLEKSRYDINGTSSFPEITEQNEILYAAFEMKKKKRRFLSHLKKP